LDNFDGPPRLTNWICATQDLAKACKYWPDAGETITLERGDLHWQMAVPSSGELPFEGLFPPLIEWAGTSHPAAMLTPTGAKLMALTIRHPRSNDLSARLGKISGATIRFEHAGTPELIAEFDTPHGRRILQ
jgi:hypothetical protein